MSRPKTAMNQGSPAAGSRSAPAGIRSAARSATDRADRCQRASRSSDSAGRATRHGSATVRPSALLRRAHSITRSTSRACSAGTGTGPAPRTAAAIPR